VSKQGEGFPNVVGKPIGSTEVKTGGGGLLGMFGTHVQGETGIEVETTVTDKGKGKGKGNGNGNGNGKC
jgi:hypothetical protein